MFTKAHILAEIRRTAHQNGGKALGTQRFRTETGIKPSDWQGKFWARWGDALVEAGFQPNQLSGPRSEEELLGNLALFVRELGHFPVDNEIKLKARTQPGFPWHTAFAKFGGKRALVDRVHAYCLEQGLGDVADICAKAISPLHGRNSASQSETDAGDEGGLGYVYMLKSGRYYKIGRTNAVGRRERELAIQLPDAAKVVHSIKTDDPPGIEAYWHGRFKDRRKNGEWFELAASDIAAFRRRKFM